jgi:SAM-dependent methyltransferase
MANEELFSDRVESYVRARPGYPPELFDILSREVGLAKGQSVVDLGAGTGILTRMLLDFGCTVYAVEPNPSMAEAARQALGKEPRFIDVRAPAEATGLADSSVDGAIAAQAFHWFDPARTRAELLRILRPGGWVALVWNIRRSKGTPLLEGYEQLLRSYGKETYTKVSSQWARPSAMGTLFGENGYRTFRLSNKHSLDQGELLARAFSSSYLPAPGQPNHNELRSDLIALFSRHQERGVVEITYDTDIFCARLR